MTTSWVRSRAQLGDRPLDVRADGEGADEEPSGSPDLHGIAAPEAADAR
jgi:hypothetical protein